MTGKAPEKYDAIVLGAGAAGMMCASVAGQRGKHVLLLDHAEEPGKKILISGGGRCNFTNLNTPPERFLSSNPHFAKSALRRYTPQDFIALVDAHGIAWHEKTLGQLFCDGSARQIVELLLDECAKGGVEPRLGQPVSGVEHNEGGFRVHFGSEIFEAAHLVIATGGQSIPKMGASGFAYELARKFGHKIVEPRPALVPLKLGEDEALFRSLSGVSVEVVARTGKAVFREAALFTHKGLSGPAILQLSSYWKRGDAVRINFLPDEPSGSFTELKRANPGMTVRSALAKLLPTRLAEALAERLMAEYPRLAGELANVPDKILTEAETRLSDWAFHPTGTEGFAKAEVTAGGISTDGLSSKTMESKHVAGLYAIGEAVDVTGWLGGYNFQWAWASGCAAGQAIGESERS